MNLNEYSKKRAEKLNYLNLSDSDSPFKVQWFELVNSKDSINSFYKGSHTHAFFEIHFIFSGNISYKIGEKIFNLTANQAVIIPPKTSHKYFETNNDFIKASLTFIAEDEILKSITDSIKFDFNSIITNNTNYILSHIENCNILTISVIKGKIFEILNSVFSSLKITLPNLNTNYKDARLNTAINFINNNISTQISCEDVAKECCLSIKQLDRIFKKYLNISIHEYIVNTRIKFAKRLINNGEYSFKEIVYKLGFKNESSFNIFFKRHTGFTPGEYRKNLIFKEEII